MGFYLYLLIPSGGAERRMYLFLRLNRRQLIIDGDGESSDIGLIVLLHAHTCFKNGSDKKKRRQRRKKGNRESSSSSCFVHRSGALIATC
jgi:hypothetical protein